MGAMPYPTYKKAGLIAGLLFFALVALLPPPEGLSPEGKMAAAVTALMSVWWITEAIPLAATALIPIALFPPLGILAGSDVTRAYGDSNIFLFAGGFFIAMAMQKWNLHERIALNIVLRTGTNPNRLVLGFLLATAFMSMWMSNTATALMMLPIAMAIIGQMEQRGFPGVDKFATALLLSIAYAASIGGIATLVGTPPNGVLLTQFRTLYPDAPPIGFLQWMCIGVPIAGVFLPVTWLLLTRVLFNFRRIEFADAGEQIAKRLLELGRMSRGERVVLAVWIVTALLWIFSDPIDLGAVRVPGWTSLFNDPKFLNHGTVAIASTVVLFVTPVNWRRGEFALDWEWARRIPWDILILFGGGIAMADAFRATGLTLWLGDKLTLLDGVPPILVVLAICALFTFLTEITSNTATAAILLPILGGPAAQALGVHPLLLMLPAALSVSCAFMLPVATPPNAIVFAGGHVSVPQMARAGLLLNLIGVALVTSVVYTIGLRIFDIQLDSVPAWTLQTPTP